MQLDGPSITRLVPSCFRCVFCSPSTYKIWKQSNKDFKSYEMYAGVAADVDAAQR